MTGGGPVLDIHSWTWSLVPKHIWPWTQKAFYRDIPLWRKPFPSSTEVGPVLDIPSWTWSPVPKNIWPWTQKAFYRNIPLWRKPFPFLTGGGPVLDVPSWSWIPVPKHIPHKGNLVPRYPILKKALSLFDRGKPCPVLDIPSWTWSTVSHEQYSLSRGIPLLREIIFRQEDLLKDISSLTGIPDQKGSLLERKPCLEIFCIFAKDLSPSPRRFQFLELTKACLLILWSCDPTDVKAAGNEGAVISTYWWVSL